MHETWQQLKQIFIEDHTQLTRGYRAIVNALRQGNDKEASHIAEKIDRIAGPHIEFEERWLYPRVQLVRGSDYTEQLYREHDEMVEGLCVLCRLSGTQDSLSDADRARLLAQMETGLEHAATCGTLLSHLATCSETEQHTLLDAIRQLRSIPKRWTDRRAT